MTRKDEKYGFPKIKIVPDYKYAKAIKKNTSSNSPKFKWDFKSRKLYLDFKEHEKTIFYNICTEATVLLSISLLNSYL